MKQSKLVFAHNPHFVLVQNLGWEHTILTLYPQNYGQGLVFLTNLPYNSWHVRKLG